MACSDTELMRRAAASDLEALGALFDRHQPALCAFLCRFMGDAATAEDLTQEVFWKVWQYRASYDEKQQFGAWLYTIARHAALDEIRKRERQERSLPQLTDAWPEVGFDAAVIEDLSVHAVVRDALLALPPDQRLCVVLREYEGKSHREIAEILGCSEGNARVMVHRARRALKERLKPLLESEETCVRRS
jgi:RNA polymerase sigma factor (sigma-70 family)